MVDGRKEGVKNCCDGRECLVRRGCSISYLVSYHRAYNQKRIPEDACM